MMKIEREERNDNERNKANWKHKWESWGFKGRDIQEKSPIYINC